MTAHILWNFSDNMNLFSSAYKGTIRTVRVAVLLAFLAALPAAAVVGPSFKVGGDENRDAPFGLQFTELESQQTPITNAPAVTASRKPTSYAQPGKPQLPPSGNEEELARTVQSEKIQQRLKQLGAVHYCLTRDKNTRLYSFVCKFPDNERGNRVFRAANPDDILAMERVLDDVTRWLVATRRIDSTYR